MADKKKSDVIDLRVTLRKLWAKRRQFYLLWVITIVGGYLLILGAPRHYITNALLAPEMGTTNTGGTLGDIASSFGFDLGSMQTNDAISPLLYPSLMDDNSFVYSLGSIHVRTADGQVDTNYFDYMKNYQKEAWWSVALGKLMSLLPSAKSVSAVADSSAFNPYNVSEEVDNVLGRMRGSIMLSVDKKTGVISIDTKSQDPLVCKTLADSMVLRLQNFITIYRTNKARIDEQHYAELAEHAKEEYDRARQAYARFADSHVNTVLSVYRTQEEALQNDVQLKYTTFTTLSAQLQQARAKVQERTPAFTLLKGASVPIKPAGPKRLMFALGLTFFATFIFIAIILKNDIKAALLKDNDPKAEKGA